MIGELLCFEARAGAFADRGRGGPRVIDSLFEAMTQDGLKYPWPGC